MLKNMDEGAVVHQPRAIETAAEFFKRRSEGATGEALSAFLDRVPHREPDPGDEID